MKKPLKYLSAIFLGIGILGAFSVSQVRATTVYQQLLDNSSEVPIVNTAPYTVVGEFIVNAATTFNASSSVYFWYTNPTNDPSWNVSFYISTTTSLVGTAALLVNQQALATTTSGEFSDLLIPNTVGTQTITAGHYYVIASSNANNVVKLLSAAYTAGNPFFLVQQNASFYGYITDSGGNSIPIAPGIPGFTDVGINVLQQKQYCNDNFATSTGFFSDLASGFGNALCNVGVFLFVPSTQTLSQWQNLSTTTQNRIPFSYYYDISNTISSQTATTTDNFTAFAIDLSATGVGSTSPLGISRIFPGSHDALSKQTIDTYLPVGMHDLLFTLAQFAIWVGVMFHLYHRIRPKHITHV